jgi:hypothetical protein
MRPSCPIVKGAGRPRVVNEMRNVMDYVLSPDGEFVRVDGSTLEHTGLYMVPEHA